MDRGAWWATVHGVTESDLTEWLTHTFLSGILLCSCVAVCLSIHSRWTFFLLWGQLRIKPLQTSEYRFLCGHMLSFLFGKWASPVAQQVQCRRHGSIPGLGRSHGEVNGIPLPDSCLKNPMDRGAWQAAVHGFIESDTTVYACVCSWIIQKVYV